MLFAINGCIFWFLELAIFFILPVFRDQILFPVFILCPWRKGILSPWNKGCFVMLFLLLFCGFVSVFLLSCSVGKFVYFVFSALPSLFEVHNSFYYLSQSRGGGALVFEVGYHPCKKIHVIRVIFQDQAMYVRTSFRGAKLCKIRKQGVFLSFLQIWGRRWWKY